MQKKKRKMFYDKKGGGDEHEGPLGITTVLCHTIARGGKGSLFSIEKDKFFTSILKQMSFNKKVLKKNLYHILHIQDN